MDKDVLTILEFYSGIGGMHYAMEGTGVKYQIIGAFDINTNANAVYKHNFPNVKLYQKNLEGITVQQLEKLNAKCWTMSPPCQPYTRQGKQEASKDARAKSFLHLLDLLSQMNNPPRYIFMENVKGFEKSDTREMFVSVLKSKEYTYQEVLVTPTDLAVPNSRLRYYLLAKGKNEPFSFPFSFSPIEWKDLPAHLQNSNNISSSDKFISDYCDDLKKEQDYLIKPDVLLRFYPILDIVYALSTRSCCFTKAYSKYVEGTGSVFTRQSKDTLEKVFQKLKNLENDEEKLELLLTLELQYFSPREVARFLCFPNTFTFPGEITVKQKYKLLGNSVNVFVITNLLKMLLLNTCV